MWRAGNTGVAADDWAAFNAAVPQYPIAPIAAQPRK
jgi:hypothetical protein